MEKRISELAYENGRIKNKTIFEKEGIRVAVIAISAGDQLKAHSSPVDVMVIGVAGEAEIILENKEFIMKPQQNIRFPAGAVHSVMAITDFKMLLIK